MESGAIVVDESRIVERSSQPVTLVMLILLPDGMCKLCFDGVWRVQDNIVCSGGGYVLYNHDGVVLLRQYFSLKSAVDSFDAEVQSLYLGLLDVLKYTNFLNVIVEGDCRELIDRERWSGAIMVDESRIAERSSQPVTPVRSILPPDGMCKLCFDGAWRVQDNIVCSGGGYVLYNHDGVVLLGQYFSLKSVVDSFDTEVQSLYLGLLDVLKYTKFLNIGVEGDCRESIDGTRCTKYVEVVHVEPFWKLQSLLSRFKELRIQFIY